MAKELVSPKTRLEFREYFVGTSLAQIDDAFGLADIRCDTSYQPPMSGARRCRVEQYYRTLNFSHWNDVKKLITVYEHVLDDVERQAKFGDEYQRKWGVQAIDKFKRRLERDGLNWTEGRLVPAAGANSVQNVHDAVAGLDAPEISRQLNRLREAVNEDPALAIGTAKEIQEFIWKRPRSRGGRTKGLSARHARLAVGAVATLVQFLFETHEERKET